VVGGHTILDPELKYGLCVLGRVEPHQVLSQTHARPGDRLVLTKPIGFGVAAQAIKEERLGAAEIARLVELMTTLNRGARDAALAAGVRAATDVTGFGLLGHLHHLLLGSRLAGRLFADAVPVLGFARELAAAGIAPGGSRRNLGYAEGFARFDPRLDAVERLLLADAQTSGGLLLAVPPERADRLLEELLRRGTPARAVVGEVVTGAAGSVEVVRG
jgi:selenide,water dikinase